MKTILFYTSTSRNFRTMLIGYLFELQEYSCEIILLKEELDESIDRILSDKNIFPKIKEIIPVENYKNKHRSEWFHHLRLENIAKKSIKDYKPQIVITTSDFLSTFELYLCRYGKKNKSKVVNICSTINGGPMEETSKYILLYNVHTKLIKIPVWLAKRLVIFSRYIKHIYLNIILPILIFKRPHIGDSSIQLYKGNTGMRDSDYVVTFSEKEAKYLTQSGVKHQKILIIDAPYARIKNLFTALIPGKINFTYEEYILVILDSDLIGFYKNFTPIPLEQRLEIYKKILELLSDVYPNQKIIIKPHPLIDYLEKALPIFSSISKNIEFVPKDEMVENYFEKALIIVQLPRAVSTALLTAANSFKRKIIISLDLFEEYMGDYYSDHGIVRYYRNLEEFTIDLKNGFVVNENKLLINKINDVNKMPSFQKYESFTKFIIEKC